MIEDKIFLLLRLGIFVLGVYFFYKIMKTTPPLVRKISLVSFLVLMVAIEIILRIRGAQPGMVVSFDSSCPDISIIPKDSLVDDETLLCDSNGINTFNCCCPHPTLKAGSLNKDGFYCEYQFTQETIDTAHAHGKQVLFFVGDSWTFGLNADSGYSFCSLLDRSKKYNVFNAGIPGTDLPQYIAVVKNYVLRGKIKPDKVVVCISRNDAEYEYDRKLTPGIPLLYQTNAGGLYSEQEDGLVLPNAKETYGYILNRYTLVGILGEHWYTYLLCKSVVLPLIIGRVTSLCFPLNSWVKNNKPKPVGFASHQNALTIAQQHIMEIIDDCNNAHVPVVFILLPSRYALDEKKAPRLAHVTSLNPQMLSISNFKPGFDDHPDNHGHAKIAEAIQKILEDNP